MNGDVYIDTPLVYIQHKIFNSVADALVCSNGISEICLVVGAPRSSRCATGLSSLLHSLHCTKGIDSHRYGMLCVGPR